MRHVCDLGTGLVGSGRSDIYVKSQPLPQETLSPPPPPPKKGEGLGCSSGGELM